MTSELPDIIYRRARPDDSTRIIDFQLQMARETENLELDRHILAGGVAAVFEQPELGTYYVAEYSGEPAGSLLVTREWSDWRNAFVWWIQSVYVVPEMRGRGIYRGLYQHIRQLADRDPAAAGIRLYVDNRNTAAREVYRRLGMNGDHYRVFEWLKE